MRIKQVALQNFRNYRSAAVETDSDLVLVLGDNAAGKTNFIESVYYLSNLKSFRAPDNLLVNQQEDYFSISCVLEDKELEVIVQKTPVVRRAYKIDGQKSKRIAWNPFKVVLFVPSDLNLFSQGPATRRKYLNETLVQKERTYAADLAGLEHVLKQRSSLLGSIREGLAGADQLDYWDEQLVDSGLSVSRVRRQFLEYLNDKFNHVYTQLTGFESKFKIEYKGLHEDLSKSQFLDKLRSYQAAEIASGQNLVGPHKDDFLIIKDGETSLYVSSRGELRSQVLAIKMIQAEYLSVGSDKPVVLLDDVFSELDETRRTKLIESLLGHQIFITSTEEHHLPKLRAGSLILTAQNNQIGPQKKSA